MKSRRVGHSVFCDDIRAELGNKLSLMGVYATDILIATAPPVMFAKLGVVTWVISDRDDLPQKVTLRILIPPDRTELVKIETQAGTPTTSEPDEYSQNFILRMVYPMENLPLIADGYIEIMV